MLNKERLVIVSRRLIMFAAFGGVLTCASCSSSGVSVSAAPLDSLSSYSAQNGSGSALDEVGLMVVDSQAKCGKFLDSIIARETTSDTALDGATTVFSALATAFTPIGVVHSLTAAASISSGLKTTIDTDVFAKANVSNFSQAIQATYYDKMSQYVLSLRKANPADIHPALELVSVQSIHAFCSLGSAEGTILARLQRPSPQSEESNKGDGQNGTPTTNPPGPTQPNGQGGHGTSVGASTGGSSGQSAPAKTTEGNSINSSVQRTQITFLAHNSPSSEESYAVVGSVGSLEQTVSCQRAAGESLNSVAEACSAQIEIPFKAAGVSVSYVQNQPEIILSYSGGGRFTWRRVTSNLTITSAVQSPIRRATYKSTVTSPSTEGQSNIYVDPVPGTW